MDTQSFIAAHAAQLAAFARMTAAVSGPAHVQGGGGNTSVKLPGGCLVIKASGRRLDEVTDRRAWALIRGGETVTLDGLPPERPSVEAESHALLGRYVIHTHCVYALLHACAPDAGARLRRLLPDAVFLPPAAPGDALAAQMRALPSAPEQTLILQNHGIFVSGSDAEPVTERYQAICKTLQSPALPPYPRRVAVKACDGGFVSDTPGLRAALAAMDERILRAPLYPDHLSFITPAEGDVLRGMYRTNKRAALAYEELLCAIVWLHSAARALGTELCPIPPEQAHYEGAAADYRANVVLRG